MVPGTLHAADMALLNMFQHPPFGESAGMPRGMPPGAFWGSFNGWEETGAGTAADTSTERESSNTHALNASVAAHHAEVAAKHAASLAQWVQYLWGTVVQLQSKVTELEDWKKRVLEDIRKVREEHKTLKKRVLDDQGLGDHTPLSVQLSKLQSMSPVSVNSDSTQAFPPGFGQTSDVARIVPRSISDASSPASPLCVKASDEDEETLGTTQLGSLTTKPDSMASLSSLDASQSSYAADPDGNHHEGVQVSNTMVDGVMCERAEWRIGQLSTKLRGCMGRALVSSPFSAAGLQDIRFMVCADGKDVTKGPRSRRQKELYTKKVMDGPLDGCLKLKVSSSPATLVLNYYLKVGNHRRGPFRHNFSESTVCGCDDFGVDWLKQLEADNSLVVSVEILKEGIVLPS